MSIFVFVINFIHSIAASIWIGCCFLMITISMSQKFKLIENYQSIFQTISFSLRELVSGSMILIFLTGIIMTIQKLSLVQTDTGYAIILGLKIILSLGIIFRIWQFRNSGYPKYSKNYLEWILGYNSFAIYGVLIFFLADLLENIV
jgi:putative copper export protein